MKVFARISPTTWLTTRTIFSQVFALLLFAIQAPVLGPRAFGLISIVMVFVGFCEFVPGEAAAESLISIRKIEAEHYSTMTFVNVMLSLLIGVGIFLGANRIALWFGDPELPKMLRWMAVLPAVSAFAAAPIGATKRHMQFQPLALRSIGSMLLGGGVGLALTLTGAGVWALVWQALVTRVVSSIVLWYAVPLDFSMKFSRRHFHDLVQFAAPTMVSKLLTWSSQQIPRIILGLFWGSADLGLFTLASRLGDILMEVAVVPRYGVARVELRAHADDHGQLEAALRRLLLLLSVVCFPLAVGAAAVVPTLFRVWLDPHWVGAIVPAQFMLLTCVGLVTQYMGGAVLLALNRQKAEAVVSIGQTAITVLMVVACAPYGLLATAVGIAARPLFLMPLTMRLLGRYAAISPKAIFLPQWRALAASLVMGACVWALRISLDGVLSAALTLPLLIVAGAVVYLGLVRLTMPSVITQFLGRVPGGV